VLSATPNVLYLHSHDTGRCVQPYGHAVPTPHIQRLADEGVLFRQAFCAVPACSGSRAALLTGEYAHTNGMLGLAHRGYTLNDYTRHLTHTLRAAGYWTGLVGEQHISADPDVIGYDHVVDVPDTLAATIAPAAADVLLRRRPRDRPFFLSVGFFETHRDFFAPVSQRAVDCALPPANVPDMPETRADMAAFKVSARRLDDGVGAVLDALERSGAADDTLVILTTDHGLPFPGAKATLTDRGTGVMLIMRGPGAFHGGRVVDAMVTHLDLYPTICDLAHAEHPAWLQGRSLLPLVHDTIDELHDEVFSEITFHATYEPQRSIRTRRWKYIRRFTDDLRGRPANTDDSPTKRLLLDHGWAARPVAAEQLYDLIFDPGEMANVAADPDHAPVVAALRERLDSWMRETGDPLIDGPVVPLPGSELNLPDAVSPSEPTVIAHASARALSPSAAASTSA
jgi:arylsulfatase A-like enzyme